MQEQAARRGSDEGEVVIDRSHLERATFGDAALLRDVLTLFHKQAGELVVEIGRSANGRLKADTAHRLRGAALGIGAHALAEAAAALEAAPLDAAAFERLEARAAEARAAAASLLARD